MFRKLVLSLASVFLLTLTLNFRVEAQEQGQFLNPTERALKDFFIAIDLKDKNSILRQIMPNPDAHVLWEGQKPSVEQLNMIYADYNKKFSFKNYEVGEEITVNGQKIEVTDKLVNDKQALVGLFKFDKFVNIFPLFYVKDSWRVNVDKFIGMHLKKKGLQPTQINADYWSKIENIETLLKGKACLWYLKNTQFLNGHTNKYFHWLSEYKNTAYYPKSKDCPKLKMFDQPVLETSFFFNEGYLNRIEATFYEKGRSEKKISPKEFNKKRKTFSELLTKFCGTEGVVQKIPKAFRKKKEITQTKGWVIDDETTIYLKWCFERKKKKGKKKGTFKTIEVPKYLQVVVEEFDITNDPREQNLALDFVDVSEDLQGLLALLGVGYTPYSKQFWEQNKVAFLGFFVDNYEAAWTTEQKKGEVEEFRSCYLITPNAKAEKSGETTLFYRKKPLGDAEIRLFNTPIMAMTAAFFDGKLVKFSFDFWNKGDADINSEYLSGRQGDEKRTKKIFKEMLGAFKKAGAKLKKMRSSKGKLTRIVDKREGFQAGLAKITFISKRKEYYSVQIENVNYEAYQKMEIAKNKVQKGDALRESAKSRITTVSTPDPNKPWEKEGDVYLDVPMVDQGAKGYCAPATVLRVVKWFGQDATLNEIAALMATKGEAKGGGGTSMKDVERGIKKVARSQKLKSKDIKLLKRKDFDKPKRVKKWVDENFIGYINQGVPIFWLSIPHNNIGHMNIIVGYNAITGEVLRSDSWGKPGYDRLKYLTIMKKTLQMFVTP